MYAWRYDREHAIMAETYMTIREMCTAFDVTPRTLRFYEAKELLAPERRGTRRLFTRRDRARLKLILKGKRFGFSLEDSANLPQMERAFELGRERLADLEARRLELEEIISDLKKNLDWGAELIASARKTAAE